MNYMIDTCIFNYLIDGFCTVNDLPSGKYYITHIQRDELAEAPDPIRRQVLEEQLNVVQAKKILTNIIVSGLSRSGEASCGDCHFYNIILSKLDKLKKKNNNYKDAMIGDTAIQNNFHLITGDLNFSKVMETIWGKKKVIWKEKFQHRCSADHKDHAPADTTRSQDMHIIHPS